MNPLSIIQSVRKLIREAEVEQALEQLIAFLEQDRRYNELNRAATQALSQFQKTKNDETIGIISAENAKLNYNQAINQTLLILERLEAGKITLQEVGPSTRRNRGLLIGGSFIFLALVGFILFKIFSKEEITNASDCPIYQTDAEFKVLLFPFQNFGSEKLNTHQAILRRLSAIDKDYNIKIDVGLYGANQDATLLGDLDKAAGKAKECGAQLVIIGTEEKQPQSNIITTEYRFLELELKKLLVTEQTQIDTVNSISSIISSGTITGSIEQAILLILGLAASETDHTEVAIELLEQAQPQDSLANLLRNMVLADKYMSENELDKVWKLYDQVVIDHPDYPLARQNRAALYAQKGDYAAAINDLNVRVQVDSNKAEALEQRGVLFLKTEQLKKAKEDLEQAKKLDPTSKTIPNQIKKLDLKIEEQKRLKEEADQKLRTEPKNADALNQKASASKKLGDYKTAISNAEAALQQNPDNPEAYSTLIESFVELKQPNKIKEVLQRIRNSDVTTEQLKKTSPIVKNVIDSLKKQ
ncbi:MAG: tetratricopeptide repeat protein [Saprospiraceae bacterium]|nr:tetratricopeptide repeat protein [Saprospiraceae bacterium]